VSKEKENLILLLIDLENFTARMDVFSILPQEFPLPDGFTKLKAWLESIGKIFAVFVFVSPHIIGWREVEEIFKEDGVFTIVCGSKIEGKTAINTTDDKLIELGEKMLEINPNLTHLCLASGDSDFEPLVNKAKELGIKTMIASADLKSLSRRLIALADRFFESGEKMILVFSKAIDKK